ncbi:hypothetical protein [Arthrobacter sp. Helios]|uniref:hypothetical protein n=1 Tax=Arthrobacter sp. Helios TaxID=2828862 RepID=UPI0020482838|nr:hypothetical protein [Arthrobacter sp. Helios]UPO78401.1 hypothetical protein ArtHe_06935 [Arthrobacter sp. Helios]
MCLPGSAKRMRVAFVGLAHSHPYADAGNLLALGGEVAGVHDVDAAAAADFADRFGGRPASSIAALLRVRPDVVIATPHPHQVLTVASALRDAGTLAFFNKTVAATDAAIKGWERSIAGAEHRIGTCSVLRFAPALEEFADTLAGSEVLAVRVTAQHDAAGFRTVGRRWQDDPGSGGGTAVTVGVHAWELIDKVLPGAWIVDGTGWTSTKEDQRTLSEDVAGVGVRMRTLPGRSVPVHALISGLPGNDAYALEVLTDRGYHNLSLDITTANTALGFRGLIQRLETEVPLGRVPAPWTESHIRVRNTVRAAAIARSDLSSKR